MKLAFDTETTGLPEWRLPSDDARQPHVIQFAGILLDDDDNEVDYLSTLVKPRRDATMQPEAFKAHGISLQHAYDNGIEATALLDWFMDAIGKVDLVIGHNVSFDVRIMCILSARWTGAKWDCPHPQYCTLKRSQLLVDLPPTDKMIAAGRTTPKPPKLSEAYEHFFGEELQGAHDALVDVRASVRIYQHLVKNLGGRI